MTAMLDFSEALDAIGLWRALQRQVDAAGGQAAWARKHDISPSQVCEALSSTEPMGPRSSIRRALLQELGLRPVELFVPARRESPAAKQVEGEDA